MFGSDRAAKDPTTSRKALSQMMTTSPSEPTARPETIKPETNAADPAARTQPYSNPLPAISRDAESAIASAIGVKGASKADCARFTSKKATKAWADTYAIATAPAPPAQIDKAPRHVRCQSASRPTSGPDTNRRAVPTPITTAIC